MLRYTIDRIIVGPETNEVIISIGRTYNIHTSNLSNIKIEFTKRNKSEDVLMSTWVPYSSHEGRVHFHPPVEFMSDVVAFPKGFYDGVFYIDECPISSIELVKAPGHYIRNVRNIQDACVKDSDWVEPPCEVVNTCECDCYGTSKIKCECTYAGDTSCPTCFNETNVSRVIVKQGYIEWESESTGVDCTSEDVTPSSLEDVTEDDVINARCVVSDNNAPLDVSKKSNLKEGYTTDVDC